MTDFIVNLFLQTDMTDTTARALSYGTIFVLITFDLGRFHPKSGYNFRHINENPIIPTNI